MDSTVPMKEMRMGDSVAIQHCEKQLARAQTALEQLQQAAGLAEAQLAWSDLLSAASRIYSKLEQGSKINGKAKAWFGRRKSERKNDPLLSYIHHARNSDEHGIEEITANIPRGSSTIGFRQPYDPDKLEGKQIRIGSDTKGNVVVTDFDPEIFEVISYARAALVLTRVTDTRYGDGFDPPRQHLGMPLDDVSPLGIAKLALPYLEQLTKEARAIGI